MSFHPYKRGHHFKQFIDDLYKDENSKMHFDRPVVALTPSSRPSCGPLITVKHKFNCCKLVLLANRFRRQSILWRLPVDVACIIARMCVETVVVDRRHELYELFERVNGVWDDVKRNIMPNQRCNFLSIEFIAQKLYKRMGIPFGNGVTKRFNQRKIDRYEQLWREICTRLGW